MERLLAKPQASTLSNIFRISGVWGDSDVYDLAPMRTRHIERLVPTDPQKTFLKKYIIFEKNILQQKKNENAPNKEITYLESL